VPALAACDHYAGSERFMRKALELQAERGGAFDVTLDLEDGAPVGREREHADLAVACSPIPSTATTRPASGSTRPAARTAATTCARWSAAPAGAWPRHAAKATSARQVAEFVNLLQGACAPRPAWRARSRCTC
jgi:hypothetical protein